MVKVEPLQPPQPPQPPTKLEFLEFIKKANYWPLCIDMAWHNDSCELTLADLETSPFLLERFEEFQMDKLSSRFIEEYFYGDWREGKEIRKVVVTQRLYQTSPNSTQD